MSVLVQCPCSSNGFVPSSSRYPIARLLFCSSVECKGRIKCPSCLSDEVVCFYCPNCLFEVPSASTKAERNRCARNCFECPVCCNTLTVVSSMDTPADAKHYLSCGVCRWDSLEIGLQFDRPTGLAMQMQKAEDDRKDVQEFANLRSHFEKTTRLAMSTAGPGSSLFRSSTSLSIPPSLLANIPALASLSAFGASKTSSFASLDGDPNGANSVANYVPKFKMDGSVAGILEDDEMDKMKKLTIDDATFLSQRMRQIGDQPRVFSGVRPQRILLRTKRAKRCKDCDTLVCKPEQKAQIPKFTVLMPALDYIPKLTIAQPPPSIPLKEGEVARCKVNIRFANPLATPIRVLLATVPPEESHTGMCRVDGISAPAFTLDAYNELSEFEDDKKNTAASGGGGWFGTKGPEIEVGLVEKRNNWAIVAVDVIVENTAVLAQGSPMQFPLLVKFFNGSDGGKDGSDSGSVSFWAVVGL